MELVTIDVVIPGPPPGEAEVRALAQRPVPDLPGLRARWWRPAPRGAVGRYLFANGDAADRFEACADDPVGAALRRRGTVRVARVTLDGTALALDRPVFVVSAPRAGSTLLHGLLAQAEGAWSIDGGMQAIVEGIPALHLARRDWDSQVLTEADADPDTAATLRAALLAALVSPGGTRLADLAPAARPARVRVVEACPENALRLPFLRAVFPDARLVYLQRDLRQNVSSMVEAWNRPGFVAIPDLPGWRRRSWCFLLPPGWRRMEEASPTALAAFQWRAANRGIVDELDAVPRDRRTTVTYDDLVADPAGEVARLCAFAELDVGDRLARELARPLPLSATTVTAPSPVKWRSHAAFDPDAVRHLQPLAGEMRNLRVVSPRPVLRTDHPTTTRFAWFVDDLNPVPAPEDLVVAPSLAVQLGSAVPVQLAHCARHRERFVDDHPVLWVEDPAFGLWAPVWLRRDQVALTRQLRPGAPPPATLDAAGRGRLAAAGVLVSPDAARARAAFGANERARAPAALEAERLVVLPALLPANLTAALAGYYRALLDSGDWPLGDDQVARRHGWHDERVARFVHVQLAPALTALADRRLKPTYSYASAYRGGAQLSAHMDREQCDYTLSLMVDEVVPDESGPWPLWFQGPGGRRSVVLGVGDGVLFRGCELPHWREPASEAHEQVNLLFHFVAADWSGVRC